MWSYLTKPEITVSGNPGVESVCKERDPGEMKEPGEGSAERQVSENFSGCFGSFPISTAFVQKVHRLEVLFPGKVREKLFGKVLLEMEIPNEMTPVPSRKKVFRCFAQDAVGIVDQGGVEGLVSDTLRTHGRGIPCGRQSSQGQIFRRRSKA